MIDSTDSCKGLICCDPNPFEYQTPQTTPSLSIDTSTICSICKGSAFSTTITANGLGLALTWSIVSGALPTGLTFHGGYNETGTVVIDGTPTVSGNFTITVQAINPQGISAVQVFQINVMEITSPSTLPTYTVGVFYQYQLQATGGSGNYLFTLESGSLPNGLSLSPSGLISGTPL